MDNNNTFLISSIIVCIIFFGIIMPCIDKKNIRENFENLI